MPRKKASDRYVISVSRPHLDGDPRTEDRPIGTATRPYSKDGLMRSVFSVVLEINRLCIRLIPPFTMSENEVRKTQGSCPDVLSLLQTLIPSRKTLSFRRGTRSCRTRPPTRKLR